MKKETYEKAKLLEKKIQRVEEHIASCNVPESMAAHGEPPGFVSVLMEAHGLSGDAAAKINAIALADLEEQHKQLTKEFKDL